MAKKFIKVGTVQAKKSGDGVTVSLGSNSKNPKYATTTEIVVRDGQGNVLGKAQGGYLMVQDPRQRPGITEDQASKIPDWIKYELVLVTEE